MSGKPLESLTRREIKTLGRRKRPADKPPVELTIESMDDQGRGVARLDGKVVFVANALPGERVVARYTRLRGRYDEATAEQCLEPSPHRVEPRCTHANICGGCVLQHVSHDEQLRIKQARLADNLERLGSARPERWVEPVAEAPWGYRSRARLGVKHVPKKGGVLVGFRERAGHRLADLNACEVLHPRVGQQISNMKSQLTELEARARLPQIELSMSGWGEDTAAPDDRSGALVFRHLDDLSGADEDRLIGLVDSLELAAYGQAGGPDTVAPLRASHAVTMGYDLPDFGLRLQFGANDFTQVNMAVNRRMVAQALAWLRPEEFDRVLDLFCGIGNFTLPIARTAGQVFGVEGAAGAVARARDNAKLNAIDNCAFEVADLSDASTCKALFDGRPQALLLDPPRSGAAAVVEAMGHLPKTSLPTRIVYVSCSPASLARDVQGLTQALGYTLRQAGIVDMFPHTNHVESMALLER